MAHEFNAANVDSELERRSCHQRANLAVLQPAFGGEPQLARKLP